MMLAASSAQALRTRVRDGEGTCRFWRSTFIGSDAGKAGVVVSRPSVPEDSLTLYPVAYLIELDPRSDLAVHYHRANQFQVFVDGDGHLGRRPVRRVVVQYAGAYTAYGPIRPGDRGLQFFTLRDAWDPGARLLPAHKDELRLARSTRREAVAAPIEVPDAAALRATERPQRNALIAPSVDAMGAWSQQLPADAPVVAPVLAGSGGQFWLVLGGALQIGSGPLLPPGSCVWLGAEDPRPDARAGAEGLFLLLMRLPSRRAQDAAAGRGPAGVAR